MERKERLIRRELYNLSTEMLKYCHHQSACVCDMALNRIANPILHKCRILYQNEECLLIRLCVTYTASYVTLATECSIMEHTSVTLQDCPTMLKHLSSNRDMQSKMRSFAIPLVYSQLHVCTSQCAVGVYLSSYIGYKNSK